MADQQNPEIPSQSGQHSTSHPTLQPTSQSVQQPDYTNYSELQPIKQEICLDLRSCQKCDLPIHDKNWLEISSRSTGGTICIHEACSRCTICQVQLDSQCYLRGNLLYCKSHYHSVARACGGCHKPILETEYVVPCNPNLLYHVACFRCINCDKTLQPSQQCILINEGFHDVAVSKSEPGQEVITEILQFEKRKIVCGICYKGMVVANDLINQNPVSTIAAPSPSLLSATSMYPMATQQQNFVSGLSTCVNSGLIPGVNSGLNPGLNSVLNPGSQRV